MKRLTLLSVSIVLLTNLIYSQSVEIKDSSDETLLIVNDEGTDKSSLTLPSSPSAPTITDNKLFNEGGALMWNGMTLATGNSLWTLSGSNVYRNTGNVGIGTTNPLSRLSVGGEGETSARISSIHTSPNGNAVYGYASSFSGSNYGGYFIANGSSSRGIYGEVTGDSGYGVYGYASSSHGIINYGGYFKAEGESGRGVGGIATGMSGRGVNGYASSFSGINYGVFGKTESPAGYAGYFHGRGYFSGNVGIGTHTPDEKLHIAENMRLDGAFEDKDGQAGSVGQILSSTETGTDWISAISIGGDNLGNHIATQDIDMATFELNLNGGYLSGDGEDEGVFVNIDGRVGIGTDTPAKLLHIYTDTDSEIALFENKSVTDPDGIVIRAGADENPSNDDDFINFQDGDGTPVGSVDGDGIGGVRFNTTSDARLKTKIRDYADGLKTVNQIKVRLYEKKSAPGIENIGFLAQELQKVYPQAVSGSPDSDLNKEPMMVDYGNLTPILIGAIQEQTKLIEDLTKRIEYLESD